MDAEIKAQWLTALRSGEYKQGKNHLRSLPGMGDMQYCCLGVLCDLQGKTGNGHWSGNTFIFGEETEFEAYDNEGHGILPETMLPTLGLNNSNPVVLSGQSLAELNDAGMTFAEIADIIEENL